MTLPWIQIAITAICITAMPATAIAERGGNGKNANGNRGNSAVAHANRDTRRGDTTATAANRDSRRGDTSATAANRDSRRGDATLNAANGNSANARANPSNGFCAPGLRKNADGCVPPGQAANGVTATDRAEQKGYRYVAGATLTPSDYTLLPNYSDYDLPDLPAGEVYAVINRTAVVIDETTQTLLRVATR